MDWTDIGFPSQRPADFPEKLSLMGIENLLTITDKRSKYREQLCKMMKEHWQTWKFFAVTGLFITEKL